MRTSWREVLRSVYYYDPAFFEKVSRTDRNRIGLFCCFVNIIPALLIFTYLALKAAKFLHLDQSTIRINHLASESGPILGRLYILAAAVVTGGSILLLLTAILLAAFLVFPIQARLFFTKRNVVRYTLGMRLPWLAWYDKLCMRIIDAIYPPEN